MFARPLVSFSKKSIRFMVILHKMSGMKWNCDPITENEMSVLVMFGLARSLTELMV